MAPEEVGRFFDEKGDVLGELLGGNIHFGYWLGPDDTSTFAEAGERLTDHMIEILAPKPGERVLGLPDDVSPCRWIRRTAGRHGRVGGAGG
ncbi:hypothetical protein AB0O34_11775 [Sphaerisporangium sp. NPDC088356]|uniref:hypothetical protein n=1 Tax=Sphaerisporangium sp. NPDC088356 TaxID=3154871 RepID=UPI0034429B23